MSCWQILERASAAFLVYELETKDGCPKMSTPVFYTTTLKFLLSLDIQSGGIFLLP